MASQNISVEQYVTRDNDGKILNINYSGVCALMKSKLKEHYVEQNYKGVCNSFWCFNAKFYENEYSYNKDTGKARGICYVITFKEPLSLFLSVGLLSSSHLENPFYCNNGLHILGNISGKYGKYNSQIDVRVISVSFTGKKNTKTPSDMYFTLNDDSYTDIVISSSTFNMAKNSTYLRTKNPVLPDNSDIPRNDKTNLITTNGTLYEFERSFARWDVNSNAYYDYVRNSLKEIYGKEYNDYEWALSAPKSQQLWDVNDSPIDYTESYMSPLPIVSELQVDGNTTYEYVTKIVTTDDKWSDENINYPVDIKTNWKVYIDGTKLPNYKILWENKDIEDSKDTDNARIQIQYAKVDPEYPVELRVNELIHGTNFAEYNDGNYKTNFKTLYEGAWGEVYDESIMSNLPKQSVWLLLQLDYYKNGITTVLPTQSSTKMAVLLNPSGKSLYSYADVWNTDGSTDGSTIRVITDKGIGEGDDGYQDDTDKGEEDITDGASNSVGVLTTTYAMTIERLNQLGGFLWGANIFDEFSLVNSNPIENIISCKNIPISLSGTDEIIHLGNVDTGTNGSKVASNFSTLNIGQIALPTKYNSFLDFAPYTKVTIYLPYIGFKEIDATIAIGKTLKVAYVADVITGGCIAQIFINGVRFYEFSGEMGVDIPITASNRAQVEASYISNAVGMGASLASGNITGAVDSVLASATAKYNYSSTDTPNANCVASVNRTCYVIIERPTYQELSQFNHTKGKMCNLSKTIGSLTRFTICDANIDLKGITATEQEKQEISSILSSGFFA